MINKDDVVNWFKGLESYKRIDTMCTLLNMCLPFELRFLGTCLEELGRRDAQELRGVELRVNNPQEFVADIASCQSGEPSDMKIRRKMALYLALIRACNHTCVNELFKTLDGWGTRDFVRFADGDPLQELLLVYTMATNHPVFSFDQRMKCGEIFSKIKTQKMFSQMHKDQDMSGMQQTTTPPPEAHMCPPQQQPSPIQHMTNSTPPPPQIHALPSQVPLQLMPQPAPMAMGTLGFAQLIPADPNMPTHMTVEAMQQMQLPMHQDFTIPPPAPTHWQLRNQPTMYQAVGLDTSFPPPASSPLLSQPSSPIHSRTASPTRIPTSSVQHRLNQNRQTTPSSNVSNSDLKIVDEVLIDGALNQLQQIRNGYTTRTTPNTLPRTTKSYLHQIQYQQQQQNQFAGLAYAMNSMNIIDLTQKSTASDSGSSIGSSVGEISPPETPVLMNNATNTLIRSRSSNTSLGRSNGRPDKTNTVIYQTTQQPQQQQAPPQHQQPQQLGQTYATAGGVMNDSMLNSNSNNNSNGSNSNVVSSTVLLGAQTPTPPAGGGALVNNSVILSQAQFTAPYPHYHIARPLISHTSASLPPVTTFRHSGTYQIQPNGELYPYATQVAAATQIAYLPTAGGAPTPTGPPAGVGIVSPQTIPTVRSSPSLQQTPTAPLGLIAQKAVVTLPYQPYPLSCFNCGSQSHTGRECQEASMEDVTRNSIYKLDYSNLINSTTSSTSSTPVTAKMIEQNPMSGTSANIIDVSSSVSTQTISNQTDNSSSNSNSSK